MVSVGQLYLSRVLAFILVLIALMDGLRISVILLPFWIGFLWLTYRYYERRRAESIMSGNKTGEKAVLC